MAKELAKAQDLELELKEDLERPSPRFPRGREEEEKEGEKEGGVCAAVTPLDGAPRQAQPGPTRSPGLRRRVLLEAAKATEPWGNEFGLRLVRRPTSRPTTPQRELGTVPGAKAGPGQGCGNRGAEFVLSVEQDAQGRFGLTCALPNEDSALADAPALRVAGVACAGALAQAALRANRRVEPGTWVVAVDGHRGSARVLAGALSTAKGVVELTFREASNAELARQWAKAGVGGGEGLPLVASLADQPQDAPGEEFVLKLARGEGRRFGFSYDLPSRKLFGVDPTSLATLRVAAVNPLGAVASAAEAAGRVVKPGTRILAVNGERGCIRAMAAVLSSAEQVEVTFRPPTPTEEWTGGDWAEP